MLQFCNTVCDKRVTADDGRAMHAILCMVGDMVARLMSAELGDDARDDQQLSIAVLPYTTCIRRWQRVVMLKFV